jgi:hypothetical protein
MEILGVKVGGCIELSMSIGMVRFLTGIAPVQDLVLDHGWLGADGQGCETTYRGKCTRVGGVLPNRGISTLD